MRGAEPDAKSQVTLRYEDGRPVEILQIVVLDPAQEAPGPADRHAGKRLAGVIKPATSRACIPAGLITKKTKWHINPTGRFEIGGPDGDAGLTGRKIIVDTYGGAAPHGGGAFSGKDPTKVDRSAAYACRYLAKNVVAAGLANKCTIQISYAIGVAKPLSFYVDLHGTGEVDPAKLEDGPAADDRRRHAARHPRAPAAEPPDLRPHRGLRPLRPPAGQRGRLLLGERDRPRSTLKARQSAWRMPSGATRPK